MASTKESVTASLASLTSNTYGQVSNVGTMRSVSSGLMVILWGSDQIDRPVPVSWA